MLAMSPVTAEAALTDLLLMMRRSFPQYLRYAHPYESRSNAECEAVLDDVVADQTLMAERAVEQLSAAGITPPNAEFPLEFTGLHDLSLDYLIDRAIQYQQSDLQALGALAAALPFNQSIRSLVDEAKGMATAHLESLEECRRGSTRH